MDAGELLGQTLPLGGGLILRPGSGPCRRPPKGPPRLAARIGCGIMVLRPQPCGGFFSLSLGVNLVNALVLKGPAGVWPCWAAMNWALLASFEGA